MDVAKTIASLGIDGEVRGAELIAACPAHVDRTGKPDNDPSWSVNLDHGAHHCFSCGWKGSLKSLVEYFGGTLAEQPLDLEGAVGDALKLLNEVEVSFNVIADYPVLPEASLRVFTAPPTSALLSRMLSAQSCQHMGVLWDPRTASWILPIRDERGRLMGWQIKGTKDRRFRNFPSGVQKRRCLFGAAIAESFDWAVVVESPLDAVRLYALGIPAVATYGSSVSDEQLRLLSQWRKVVLALDNDEAGRRGTAKIQDSDEPLNLSLLLYPSRSVKDVGDMTDDEILYAVENSRSVLI